MPVGVNRCLIARRIEGGDVQAIQCLADDAKVVSKLFFVTASTGFSVVAMFLCLPPTRPTLETDRRIRHAFAMALDPLEIVIVSTGKSDHLPCPHIPVTAVDGIGKVAFLGVLQEHIKEHLGFDAVVQKTLERFERIDAVVNIAGAVPALDLFQMLDSEWNSGMELKLHAARRVALHAWNALKTSQGSLVFISGNAADIPKSTNTAIAAINAAIEVLANAFADQGLKDGIQVNAVSPGSILTSRRIGMLEKAAAAKGISLDDMKDAFLKQAGVGRFGEPEEIAELLAFVVSPRAKYLTGTVLRMDGGEVKSL